MGEFVKSRLPDAIGYYESAGLSLVGRGSWRTTRCDFHGGSDSLRVNVDSGAWVCMACGTKGGDVLVYHMQSHGLEFIEAARALGAYVFDGKAHRGSERPTTLSARAALGVVAFESLVIATAAGNIAQGVVLSDRDRTRVMQAAGRIGFIAQEVGAC